jgi:hypothetical protein
LTARDVHANIASNILNERDCVLSRGKEENMSNNAELDKIVPAVSEALPDLEEIDVKGLKVKTDVHAGDQDDIVIAC